MCPICQTLEASLLLPFTLTQLWCGGPLERRISTLQEGGINRVSWIPLKLLHSVPKLDHCYITTPAPYKGGIHKIATLYKSDTIRVIPRFHTLKCTSWVHNVSFWCSDTILGTLPLNPNPWTHQTIEGCFTLQLWGREDLGQTLLKRTR
jgi:hypothetical protein